MTQEQFLLDTVEYYSTDTNRRCVSSNNGGCKYSPVNAHKEGISEGCAIGRHLSPELQLKLDNRVGGTSVAYDGIFEQLPEWMKELTQDFLRKIQSLHDSDEYWNEKGLSLNGKEKLKEIIIRFSLKEELFEKYI